MNFPPTTNSKSSRVNSVIAGRRTSDGDVELGELPGGPFGEADLERLLVRGRWRLGSEQDRTARLRR